MHYFIMIHEHCIPQYEIVLSTTVYYSITINLITINTIYGLTYDSKNIVHHKR